MQIVCCKSVNLARSPEIPRSHQREISRVAKSCSMGEESSSPAQDRLRILSFNVNGLRAILKRLYGPTATVATLLKDIGEDADIVCFQETKLRRTELATARELALVEGWDSFFACASSARGYSGTATFCRTTKCLPFAAEIGFCADPAPSQPPFLPETTTSNMSLIPHPSLAEHFSSQELANLDAEGRVVVTDHGSFVLFNVYGPAITSEDAEQAQARMAFKMRFYSALERRWAALVNAGRAVVVVGDLNIAPGQIDYPDPDPDFFKASRPDRRWMRAILGQGTTGGDPPVTMVDCFRAFHPTRRNAFTVWSTATGARANNYGSRIDLCLAAGLPIGEPHAHVDASLQGAASTAQLKAWVGASDIEPQVQGSDHCPVWVDICFSGGPIPCATVAPPCAMRFYYQGKQTKLHAWLAPAASAPKGKEEQAAVAVASTVATSQVANGSSTTVVKQVSLKAFFAKSDAQGGGQAAEASIRQEMPSRAEECGASEASAGGAAASCAERETSAGASALHRAELAASAELQQKELASAKSAWQRIQQKMQVPRCQHGEPAALKKVGKAGPNHGRWFYMCQRPEGKGPQAQCSFFQWVEKKSGDAARTTRPPTAEAGASAATKRTKIK